MAVIQLLMAKLSKYVIEQYEIKTKQAGAELGKAQPKLGLGRIKIKLALAKSRKVVWD